MYSEMQQVIASSNTFTFIYKKPPKRDVGEEEDVQQMVAAKPVPPNTTTSSRAQKRGAARAARRTEHLSISSWPDIPTPIPLSLLADCPYCGGKVKSTKLESHKTNKCPKKPV